MNGMFWFGLGLGLALGYLFRSWQEQRRLRPLTKRLNESSDDLDTAVKNNTDTKE